MHVLGEFEQQQADKFAPSFAPSLYNFQKIPPESGLNPPKSPGGNNSETD